MCARWVPRELKDREENKPNEPILATSLTVAGEGEETLMLNRIVTGDESWEHPYQPESKCASVLWKHPSSPSA
jgi:hypothetical protein